MLNIKKLNGKRIRAILSKMSTSLLDPSARQKLGMHCMMVVLGGLVV